MTILTDQEAHDAREAMAWATRKMLRTLGRDDLAPEYADTLAARILALDKLARIDALNPASREA